MTQDLTEAAVIKELLSLNIATYGLSNPNAGKKDKEPPETPFLSLQEIKKESEQIQVGKMINPNFKG